MIIPKAKDAQHKYQMLRLLRTILTDKDLRLKLQFKGGTYAALRGELNRFSVDLDFDLPDKTAVKMVRQSCYRIFKKLDLEIKDESKRYLQFFLRYQAKEKDRNTLKLEINDQPNLKNSYEKVHLQEINMYCQAHSLETMVGNKLVAAMARFDKNGKIAGRDFYDLHHFFLNGFKVNREVVEYYAKTSYVEYLKKLRQFIQNKVTEKLLNQDLNPLLPSKKLNQVIGNLKPELLALIKDEIDRA
jgi:predicted nucleotidyltransferase component of viral defense system